MIDKAQVAENALGVAVIILFFFFIYMKMKGGKVKDGIKGLFGGGE